MNFLEHRFTLDVRRDAPRVCVRVRKGDTARRLRIALVQGVVPYEIRSDCYAVFSAVKPDGNRLFNPCVIEDNRIVYELTPQTTAVIGLVECEIRLYGADNALITSPGFDMIVDEVLYDEDKVPQSETEVDALTSLISDAAEVIAEVRELIGDFGAIGFPALGDEYEGKLLYVVGGALVPLALGPGLEIRNGTLYITGGGGDVETGITVEADSTGVLRVYSGGEEILPTVDENGVIIWPGVSVSVDASGTLIFEEE